MPAQKKIKKVLFLKSNQTETELIKLLRSRGCDVDCFSEKNFKPDGYDLIISFGYRYIIPENIICNAPHIINLHISLLPYNKGAHPNFWAHMDSTPSGVTIHLIDTGIDTGPYLYQKKINFDTKKLTFKESYQILKNEIETLFIKNIDEILNLEYKLYKYSGKGSFHNASDLPSGIDWDEIIYKKISELKSRE